MNDFGNRLKTLRKSKKITQNQLADFLKVSPTTLQKWEADASYPDAKQLYELIRLFDVSYGYLIEGVENDSVVLPPQEAVERAFMKTRQETAGKNFTSEFEASFFLHFLKAECTSSEK